MAKIDIGIEKIVKRLSKLEKTQDKIIPRIREIVRFCSNAIKLMHGGKISQAKKMVDKAKKILSNVKKEEKLSYMFLQAEQEVVEASILLSIIENKSIPKAEELGVEDSSYLTGICDCVGELRRQMLEQLKKGRKKEALRYFEVMDAIADELVAIRFSDSLVRGFRQKQDIVRSQLERARSEILHTRGK
ncbi:MAG: hypothetical protein QXW70_04140 [Candidatus Anstonellales archaeon]